MDGWSQSDYNASLSSNWTQLEPPTGTELAKIQGQDREIYLQDQDQGNTREYYFDRDKNLKNILNKMNLLTRLR